MRESTKISRSGAFELSALGLLRDTETAYWNLYLQYRLYHTAVVAHNSALRSWREAYAKLVAGGVTGFTPVDEATARDQLYNTRATAEQTLSNLYTNETDLRRLLGLPVNDGRIIRPVDEPLTAKFVPDWYASLTEGLTRRVELRTQKWSDQEPGIAAQSGQEPHQSGVEPDRRLSRERLR